MYVRNYAEETSTQKFNLKNFDIAYQISIFGNDYLKQNIDKFVSVNLRQYQVLRTSDGMFSLKANDIPLGKCDDSRFNGESSQTQEFGLQVDYQCPLSLNFDLYGNLQGKNSSFLKLSVSQCQEDINSTKKKCASQAEIDKVMSSLTVNIAYMSQYFDVNDLSPQPVKTLIKTLLATTVPNVSQNYVMKVSQNQAFLSDSIFSNQFGERDLTYSSISADSSFLTTTQNLLFSDNFQVYFILDENVQITKRQVYTISDALSSTGGMLGSLALILSMVLKKLQEYLFFRSVINDQYFVHKSYLQDSKTRKHIQNSNQQSSNTSMNSINKLSTTQDYLKKNYEKGQITSGGQYEKLLDNIKNRIRIFSGISANKRYRLYQKAKETIEGQLELQKIMKTIVGLKFLNKIILSRYQRQLMIYSKANLVELNEAQPQKITIEILKQKLENKYKVDDQVLDFQSCQKNSQKHRFELSCEKATHLDKQMNIGILNNLNTQFQKDLNHNSVSIPSKERNVSKPTRNTQRLNSKSSKQPSTNKQAKNEKIQMRDIENFFDISQNTRHLSDNSYKDDDDIYIDRIIKDELYRQEDKVRQK
ncbi:UNKNOWN [Stylonychia lemnae]|uniref:Uncharacterized protein n=1 Tax=Stylonychia lemnae TaxID=5949 RepID=A0A078AY80_STYLE|nr:UNKNOWN [Stylonychia lemnae]|eukprot:CDW87086.1 UNKNOWN [Stylonychia lemnae]